MNEHIKYNSIENHYLSKHVQYIMDRFQDELPNTTWCALEKLHGANISFLFKPEAPVQHFARRFQILGNEFFSTGQLFSDYDKKLERIQEFSSDTKKTVRLYGELFGPGINKGVDYGDHKRIRFFDTMSNDIYNTQKSSELFFRYLQLDELYLYHLQLFKTLDEALAFNTVFDSKLSTKVDNTVEGVVIKPWDVFLGKEENKLFYFKKKNEKFLEKKQKSAKKKKNVSPEVHKWHEVFLGYIHQQRIESVFSKEGRIDDIRDLGKYIPLIMLDASDTFFREEEFPVNNFDKNEQRYIFNASKEIVELLKKEIYNDG